MGSQIVCAVDESFGAKHALVAAANLARDLGLPLTLVHAVSQLEAFEDEVDPAYARAKRLLAERQRDADVPRGSSSRVVVGEPEEALRRMAGEEETELLVLGSRGRGELAAALLGSVSAAVVDGAGAPVMVVPPDAEPGALQPEPSAPIVCAVGDVSRDAGMIGVADDLATRLDVTLHLITVDAVPVPVGAGPGALPPAVTVDSPSVRRRQILRELDDLGVRSRVHVGFGAAAAGVEHVAEAEGARMIVTGSHVRGALRRLLLGSVSRTLASSAKRPVLMVPDGAAPSPNG
jgi:nucleotide-binding universal stress UspA family protein